MCTSIVQVAMLVVCSLRCHALHELSVPLFLIPPHQQLVSLPGKEDASSGKGVQSKSEDWTYLWIVGCGKKMLDPGAFQVSPNPGLVSFRAQKHYFHVIILPIKMLQMQDVKALTPADEIPHETCACPSKYPRVSGCCTASTRFHVPKHSAQADILIHAYPRSAFMNAHDSSRFLLCNYFRVRLHATVQHLVYTHCCFSFWHVPSYKFHVSTLVQVLQRAFVPSYRRHCYCRFVRCIGYKIHVFNASHSHYQFNIIAGGACLFTFNVIIHLIIMFIFIRSMRL
mmetsp:Transcript_18681/g.61336  ORF Transcript_18681/g.61336 Transcript_18681/m.61336 type:complete len:283 (-) Transcript_18681:834-1682(-)